MTLISAMAHTRAGNLAVMSDETAAPLKDCDVVYVVRPGDDNEALRYSLRSLANMPHRGVFIVGYCPKWVTGVRYFPTEQTDRPDQENSNNNLRIAAGSPFLSDDFVFMNDDFFVMRPTETLPAMHQGSLTDRIDRYRSGNRMLQAYSLITTRDELRKIIPNAELYSYELHMPMLMNKRRVKAMFEYWPRPLMSLRPRTMYGNLYQIEGLEVQDAKTSSESDSQFISTISATGGDDACWQLIRGRFPTACQYEAGANS